MNLLTTYFDCQNQDRLKEYITCLSKNVDNPYINRIYLFLEDENRPGTLYCKDTPKGKIKFIENCGRVTYSELFQFCNDNLSGESCIISNADIEFDDTLKIIYNEDLQNCFLCLSRWNRQEDGSLEYHREADSQDCWIFRSPVPDLMTIECNFFMGQPGCDNRVAYVAKKSGMIPTNPSPVIRPIHRHLSTYRSYNWCDRLNGFYLRVWPVDDWNISRLDNGVGHYEEFEERRARRRQK